MTRMGTIQGLVEHHTLAIDDTAFAATGDKVLINGHFYSDKLVTPALFGALAYWPLHAMGLSLHMGFSWAYYLIDVLVMKGFWLAGLFAFYSALRWTGTSERWRWTLTLALGVGSTFLSWTATFNNHALTASWVMIGFALLLRAKYTGRFGWQLFWSGLFLGLGGSSDPPMLAFAGTLFLYVVALPNLRRGAFQYAIGVFVALVPALTANFLISGSLKPVQLDPANFLFQGSIWTADKLTGSHMNSGAFLVQYTQRSLIGDRGFLSYNPLSYLALTMVVLEAVRRRKFMAEALVVLVSSVVVIGYYLLMSNNYGGYSYSIRWFVPLLPLWFFFLYGLGEGRHRWLSAIFGLLFVAGIAFALVGVLDPWSNLNLNPSPLRANLINWHKLWPELLRTGMS